MIRIVKQGKKYYGIEIDSVSDDEENITTFLECSESVLLVSSIEDVDQFDLDPKDIEMIQT